MERGEMQRHIGTEFVHDPLSHLIDFPIRVVLLGNEETENDAVIGHLKTAAVALEAFNGGDAAASVQAAMRSIRDIVDKLPD
jgi:hypothetical protein